MTTIKERINKYITERLEFNGVENKKFNALKPIFDKFKQHLPDIKFLTVDDMLHHTIIIYTNYNIRFEIQAKLNKYNVLVPIKCSKNNTAIVHLYPLGDKLTFYKNTDYYNVCESPAPLYVNENGYILIQRNTSYDIWFDINQCNFIKGITPCAIIMELVYYNDSTYGRDSDLEEFFNYITSGTP